MLHKVKREYTARNVAYASGYFKSAAAEKCINESDAQKSKNKWPVKSVSKERYTKTILFSQ